MIENGILTKTSVLLRGAFKEYYFKSAKTLEEPKKIEQREFGYSHFGQPGMVRHLSFRNTGELIATLVKEVPSDVYCSNAYYRFPTSPMQDKEWTGADMIFDIDGKDLGLPCVPSHSHLLCATCGASSPGAELSGPYVCQSCGSRKYESSSIPCSRCVEGSKKEVVKLVDFLKNDLGIGPDNIGIYFSGNNGFHVHISDEAYVPLDPAARSDLVGYVRGAGLMAESLGVRKGDGSGTSIIKFPRGGIEYGWRSRMADELGINSTSTIKLRNIVDHAGGYSGFKMELDKKAREKGARIDPQVTTDIHRVFRMPGTLNSKSGLAKTKCSNLGSFDPFVDACLLGDSKTIVKVKSPVKIKLKGKAYNISKESAELPAFVAVYLVCKGLAEAA
ncbi:MAG TPA: DNA primase small subunit domain-containing protein [Nitrososphaera sp.]